jgi:hypothetical protein
MKKLLSLLLIAIMCITFACPTIASAATVKISKTRLTMNIGKTYTLKITGTKQTVKWTSNKSSVASVSSKGKVTAKAAGTATITATVNKKPYKCQVTVKDPDVEAIFDILDNSGYTMEEYIENVKSENPDFKAVKQYDDTHYIATMKESKRRSLISDFDSMIDGMIKEYLSSPDYSSVFTDVIYNDSMSEITISVVAENYESTSSFNTIMAFRSLSYNYQALKLIDPKDRYLVVDIVDAATRNTLYKYDSRKYN